MTSKNENSSEPTPEQVSADLTRKRELATARKRDRLARIRDRSERRIEAREIRQVAARDQAAASLERAKLAADIAQSAEARALRVQRTRSLTLLALMPVLAAFAAWSTAGVHAGATAMLEVGDDSAMWWALWLLEPALIGTVAWIILCRARLESSGGKLGDDASRIMWSCLGVSILLNAIGHWPHEWPQGAGALLTHSLGPVGAAMTAHLISIIEKAVTTAAPSEGEGVKSLAELTETTPKSPPGNPREKCAPPALAWVSVPSNARHLPIVDRAQATSKGASEKARRSTGERRKHENSEEGIPSASQGVRTPRVDKGATLPKSLKSASEKSSRALSDAELAELLNTAIADARLTAEPSVSAVQKCLSIGFERAKRVLALREESAETVLPNQLSVVDTTNDEEVAA